MDTTHSRTAGWRLSALAVPILLAQCDHYLAAQGLPAVTDPAAIDRAVAEFTGADIGAPGGARMASDRRLQLAPCAVPLAVSWHTASRTAVQVECAGQTSWRIFVAINPAPGSSPGAARPAPVVKRGDAITVMVRGRGFSVQQAGEAVEAGGVGDWIEVRTSRKAEPIRARIERPGLAIIPAG